MQFEEMIRIKNFEILKKSLEDFLSSHDSGFEKLVGIKVAPIKSLCSVRPSKNYNSGEIYPIGSNSLKEVFENITNHNPTKYFLELDESSPDRQDAKTGFITDIVYKNKSSKEIFIPWEHYINSGMKNKINLS